MSGYLVWITNFAMQPEPQFWTHRPNPQSEFWGTKTGRILRVVELRPHEVANMSLDEMAAAYPLTAEDKADG